jgi:V/A-type H+-transporting ATPase subunit F
MSRLIILTRPDLVTGFRLAGVDAFTADSVESAQELVQNWIVKGEEGLLAIDEGLLERMDAVFVKQLEAAEKLPYIAFPGGEPLGPEASRRYQIAEMIRRAIGFHITFKGEEAEGNSV